MAAWGQAARPRLVWMMTPVALMTGDEAAAGRADQGNQAIEHLLSQLVAVAGRVACRKAGALVGYDVARRGDDRVSGRAVIEARTHQRQQRFHAGRSWLARSHGVRHCARSAGRAGQEGRSWRPCRSEGLTPGPILCTAEYFALVRKDDRGAEPGCPGARSSLRRPPGAGQGAPDARRPVAALPPCCSNSQAAAASRVRKRVDLRPPGVVASQVVPNWPAPIVKRPTVPMA